MYTEQRPWGSFTILEESEKHKVKRIVVNPGQRLSYQSHKLRDELWMVVKGKAIVIVDDNEKLVLYGKSVNIKKNQKHRIENREKEPLEFIEIQTGTYFGEDDIIRYQDDYERE
ncbi:MAG: phosphomannose isomerase type II C-terminal cupin domain [Candidatus Delongbacteria bacterium]|nr:phosphomannose isomerase type II C-terminal cupin domain [Candidatus Delongbacteria bacterium]